MHNPLHICTQGNRTKLQQNVTNRTQTKFIMKISRPTVHLLQHKKFTKFDPTSITFYHPTLYTIIAFYIGSASIYAETKTTQEINLMLTKTKQFLSHLRGHQLSSQSQKMRLNTSQTQTKWSGYSKPCFLNVYMCTVETQVTTQQCKIPIDPS